MEKRKNDKQRAQRAHAKRRALQRFGLGLTKEDYAAVLDTVCHGRRTFLGRQSNRVSVFLIEFAGREMKVVYDRLRKTIVTVLPPDAEVWTRDDGEEEDRVEVSEESRVRGTCGVPDDREGAASVA